LSCCTVLHSHSMASLYRKEGSPFWYLRKRDPLTGRMLNRSTGFRADSEAETRKARQLRAEAEAKEFDIPRVQSGEEWVAWVPAFMQARYTSAELFPGNPVATLTRVKNAWAALSTYFRAKGVRSARVLTRQHCVDYTSWRAGEDADGVAAGLRKVSKNTAIMELKFLSTIMREAVERGLAHANPCLQLGLRKVKPKIKPAITDDEVAAIEQALESDDEKRRPYNEAMRISWQIAILQVCRLRETCILLRDVNLQEGTITFRIKGGREHTAMLHPDLVPLFTALKKERRERAYDMPKGFSRKWQDFFSRHKMGHLTFHCTRVTGATRLRRAGVDMRVAMEYVGHSDKLVHQVYVRARKEDQLAAVLALSRGGDNKPSTETPASPSAT
jgi:integrase